MRQDVQSAPFLRRSQDCTSTAIRSPLLFLLTGAVRSPAQPGARKAVHGANTQHATQQGCGIYCCSDLPYLRETRSGVPRAMRCGAAAAGRVRSGKGKEPKRPNVNGTDAQKQSRSV